MTVPDRFEGVAEALVAGTDPHSACGVVGQELARDGADLGEALEGLRSTFAKVLGREPDFATTRAMGVAWAEETLAYLHQLSCEDPLTGLATHAHVRARLGEVYRGVEQRGGSARTSHALVVVELPLFEAETNHFQRALALVRIAETIRAVFPGEETISRIGTSRLVVLTARHDELGRDVSALRDLVGGLGASGAGARVWIEGLPADNALAARLLDEISR